MPSHHDRVSHSKEGWALSGPFLHSKTGINEIWADLLISFIPVVAYSIYLLGSGLILNILASMVSALLAEFAWERILNKSERTLWLNAAVYGLILPFALPAGIAPWLIALGAVFSVIFGKLMLKGLGRGLVNPVLAGWAFLQIVFPFASGAFFKTILPGIFSGPALKAKFLAGNILSLASVRPEVTASSLIGITSYSLIFTILYLFFRRRLELSISIPYIAFLFIWFIAAFAINGTITFPGPIVAIAVFSAFILAADSPSSPSSKKGKLIFGSGCGALSLLLAAKTGDVRCFYLAIVLMGLAVPLIDKMSVPVPFGINRTDSKSAKS